MTDAASLVLSAILPAHLEGCAALIDRLPLFRAYGYGSEAARRNLEASLAEGRADLLCVLDSGRVAGFAWFVPRGAFDRSGYLRLIAIDDRYQGRGIGKLLIEELERRHLARGGIALLASADNPAAHRFYERLGYAQVGELRDYVRPGLHERIYYKPPGR
jgi:ribosomal protein S18 acetylase RimI-like enzyme